ncbi:MAG: hypothetical protein KBA54_01130 [Candidatus Cloacimonetes bacterium]|nr:hypothetical protein [Candidatus Cloacimonadota bacterium]
MKSKLILMPLLLAMLVLILAGCIKNNNPTGNNWSNVSPLSTTDTLDMIAGYSFAGSGKVTGTESTLLCGDYNGIESVAFMRFTGLPAEGAFHIPSSYQDSTYLALTLTRRSQASRNPVELSVYKLNQSWAADSTGLIQDANLTLISQSAFTIPDTVLTTGTEIKIPIPIDKIENWRSGADSLGLTLAIKTGGTSWVEAMSLETGRGPQLRFLYRNEDDQTTDDIEYEQRPTRDSYRVDSEEAPLLTDSWILNNITPSRIYLHFVIDNSWIKDMHGNVMGDLQRKRTTINQARLILYVKNNPYYGTNTACKLRADRLNDSLDVSLPMKIEDSRLATGIATEPLVRGDSLVVDITPIIQAYTSGDKVPYGIVIRSLQEMLNYGRIEFWHFTSAPADKKPKLRLTYTPPFL